jgi:hypothetical protein
MMPSPGRPQANVAGNLLVFPRTGCRDNRDADDQAEDLSNRGLSKESQATMLSSLVPVKTPQGQAELSQRSRQLGPRQRTLLLLVDGRRRAGELMQMAAAAGVPPDGLDELVALGMITAGDTAAAPVPGDDDGQATPPDSLLPPLRSLLPDSAPGELEEPPPPAAADVADPQLEAAREMLVRALRNEAPVSGALTLMKVRRAETREELEGLVDEVEQRIRKPRRQLIVAQLIRQVRHLLTLPPDAAP